MAATSSTARVFPTQPAQSLGSKRWRAARAVNETAGPVIDSVEDRHRPRQAEDLSRVVAHVKARMRFTAADAEAALTKPARLATTYTTMLGVDEALAATGAHPESDEATMLRAYFAELGAAEGLLAAGDPQGALAVSTRFLRDLEEAS